ncbi:MAG: squalene--hopene cyclase [Paenibacillaceae bacterium]|nr:squalene--hopene cyclase [Paenibacillaceae bacterium]
MGVFEQAGGEKDRLVRQLLNGQREDGTWRFLFENGISLDAYMIMLLRSLQLEDEPLIRRLHDRILDRQRADGVWALYADDRDGHLASTVEAYYALLYAGYSRKTDDRLRRAERRILDQGGMRRINGLLTKVMLAATGQYPWPARLAIPLEFLLLPPSSPISFHDFSSYARVHFAPVLLLADRRFALTTASSPDLSALLAGNATNGANDALPRNRGLETLLQTIHTGLGQIAGMPAQLHKTAARRAERFMLDRIEPDGTLYSYATSTILMLFALLALGYDKRHPFLLRAMQGLYDMIADDNGMLLLQNSPSTIWDTALIGDALLQAGVAADHPAIGKAADFLLAKQQRSPGDWSQNVAHPVPGGWGFSESNTKHPDVDDTTAALRLLRAAGPRPAYAEAAEKGMNWTLAMQNDDGGWPAFERGKTNELLKWLPIEGAQAAALDPSSADLTGRTLEYWGRTERLTVRHAFIRRSVDWLAEHQEEDGSWYGRWGICYLYGTWAAVTGMMAVGVEAEHPAVRRAVSWLLDVQLPDGGWGESCRSDQLMRYVPLGTSNAAQTAWALDALIAVHAAPVPAINRGIERLIALLHTKDEATDYPLGAGLPGTYYTHYHSYRYIWPLLALSRYRNKYAVKP